MAIREDRFLEYYKGELAYLREQGGQFARTYPKLAGRLELSADESPDPHVERLLEAFAFLTARVQQRLDAEFPQITTALLGMLYPHLVNPVPPLAIARLEMDSSQRKLATGAEVAKHTPLFAQTLDGQVCRFRTCYPVTLWPLSIMAAAMEPKTAYGFLDAAADVAAVLRVRLEAPTVPFHELETPRLRFHLTGLSTMVEALYELLFGHVRRVVLLSERGVPASTLPPAAIKPVGFEADEEVLPYAANAHPAYRLLQEYFVFPEKFHFFDFEAPFAGLRALPADEQPGRFLDLLFLLDEMPRQRLALDRTTFALGCTPVANLFLRTTEPIRLDYRQPEYRLIADSRRERTTEIHSIVSVAATTNPAEGTEAVEPFFSNRHRLDGRPHRAFWHARRVFSGTPDRPGTELFLSFVDLEFNPSLPPQKTLYAHTLCTNRDLALQVPAQGLLQPEAPGHLGSIACLGRPTPPAYPPLEGSALWALISMLSLNHLSLSTGAQSLETLREFLRLYGNADRPSIQKQIEAIRQMHCRRVVRRVGEEAWRGFCPGIEITLDLDEGIVAGSGGFLLGAVLRRFFSLYASINSFTQLVLRHEGRAGEWHRWEPLVGAQPLL